MLGCGALRALLLALALAGGCALHDRGEKCTPCCQGPLVLDCRPVMRGAVVPELAQIPPGDVFVFNDQIPYCALAEKDAQCLAASNSSLARTLEQEAVAIGAQDKGGHHGPDIGKQQQILRLRATHERNRAAAEALNLFLRLTEAEGGVHNARRRSHEVERMVSDIHRLQRAGLEPPISLSVVQAQQIDLVHKQVELEATIEQLNHQLIKLLGAEPPPLTRLWPEANLAVVSHVPSVLESQQLALSQRADLCALRLAAMTNGPKDLNMSRSLLGGSGSGLGMAVNPCAMLAVLHAGARREEAGVRQAQFAATLADEERAAKHDAAEAVAVLQARVVQIGLQRRRLEYLQTQLERLEKAKALDAGAGFEAHQARLDALAGEQDLLHDVIEWKRATVRLLEVEGALAIQCGFTMGAECAFAPCPQ